MRIAKSEVAQAPSEVVGGESRDALSDLTTGARHESRGVIDDRPRNWRQPSLALFSRGVMRRPSRRDPAGGPLASDSRVQPPRHGEHESPMPRSSERAYRWSSRRSAHWAERCLAPGFIQPMTMRRARVSVAGSRRRCAIPEQIRYQVRRSAMMVQEAIDSTAPTGRSLALGGDEIRKLRGRRRARRGHMANGRTRNRSAWPGSRCSDGGNGAPAWRRQSAES